LWAAFPFSCSFSLSFSLKTESLLEADEADQRFRFLKPSFLSVLSWLRDLPCEMVGRRIVWGPTATSPRSCDWAGFRAPAYVVEGSLADKFGGGRRDEVRGRRVPAVVRPKAAGANAACCEDGARAEAMCLRSATTRVLFE
jgi:hypothetical protein